MEIQVEENLYTVETQVESLASSFLHRTVKCQEHLSSTGTFAIRVHNQETIKQCILTSWSKGLEYYLFSDNIAIYDGGKTLRFIKNGVPGRSIDMSQFTADRYFAARTKFANK